jgi:hypothetical protein
LATRPDARKWIEAMNEEITALEKPGTYISVKNSGKKTVGCKWVFKIKLSADRTVEKYKARVGKGYSQQPGLNFYETFAPVARYESLRLYQTRKTIVSIRWTSSQHFSMEF